MIDLDGRTAIITGAARGQGAAEARLFARLGARVVVADADESGTAVADEIGGRFERLDVCDATGWQRLVERTGRVDVLVNNAGVYRTAPIADLTDAALRATLEVNLVGPVLGMRAVAPAMPEGGSIVNIASISGLRGHGGALAYAASKWGLRGASRSAAREFAPLGIRVNCVCPGAVDTPMIDARRLDLSHLPIPRAGTVGELARLVAFLASDASAYCTGADFVADGGATA
ncbi:SDR family NAD(P)-dependent oxidoreductase [Saccharopolyspora rosea]|uniref:SDR family NAD(P)-dependent oxidoreductase n=1 Tax=Saccharopolyspora rosea TaxID=524884 RepID=A0ABW3FVG9_9PSEU|nr:SDR family NAD(P)-dependent oxidoreductase [Saccharopolyspora rosea]